MGSGNIPFELKSRQSDAEEPVFKLYHYDPTIAGAIIFVLLFLATTSTHFYQLWRARTWFMIPLVIGGICKFQWSYRAACKLREEFGKLNDFIAQWSL